MSADDLPEFEGVSNVELDDLLEVDDDRARTHTALLAVIAVEGAMVVALLWAIALAVG